jgi:opacity protein-like surface antigen
MRRGCLVASIACLVALLIPSVAAADITAFLGSTTTPTARPAKGFAIGTGLLIVGFEFEYSATEEDLEVTPGPEFRAPDLRTFMFNGLVQTPVPIARMQFYGTIGGGVYREKLSIEPDISQTNFGTNIGGGAKITLVGPLRLRVDYRVFTLRGEPRHKNVQRLYAGVNLKF